MPESRSAAECFAVVVALVERDTDPAALAAIRARVAWLLRREPAPVEPFDATGGALAAFVDQFVIDVSTLADAQRGALFAAVGADALGIVQAVFVVDAATRLAITRERLGLDPVTLDANAGADEQLWPALETFMRTVAQLDGLDSFTSELVRLRGAAQHNCRLCRSRRSVEAVDVGPGTDLLELAERFEASNLDERVKVALRVTDAMLTQPGEIDPALAEAARTRLGVAELDEMLFDVVRNAANKIAVAFGADAPQVDEGVEYYTIDAAGDVFAAADPAVVRAHGHGAVS